MSEPIVVKLSLAPSSTEQCLSLEAARNPDKALLLTQLPKQDTTEMRCDDDSPKTTYLHALEMCRWFESLEQGDQVLHIAISGLDAQNVLDKVLQKTLEEVLYREVYSGRFNRFR